MLRTKIRKYKYYKVKLYINSSRDYKFCCNFKIIKKSYWFSKLYSNVVYLSKKVQLKTLKLEEVNDLDNVIFRSKVIKTNYLTQNFLMENIFSFQFLHNKIHVIIKWPLKAIVKESKIKQYYKNSKSYILLKLFAFFYSVVKNNVTNRIKL